MLGGEIEEYPLSQNYLDSECAIPRHGVVHKAQFKIETITKPLLNMRQQSLIIALSAYIDSAAIINSALWLFTKCQAMPLH